jgi:hypothetical protein
MVSKNIESLYNTYLAISRSSQNKPFKLRKDFSDFYETEQFVLTKKIERFLLQHPEIKPEIFFKAPYAVHPDETFDLRYYTTLSAVKAYTIYMKQLDSLSPDHTHHLEHIVKSIRFIKSFCEQNNISTVSNYISYCSNAIYPDWFLHLKNRNINKFILFGFDSCRKNIESVKQPDIIQLLIPDFFQNYYSDLGKFENSSKMKPLVTKGLALLQKQINIS